MRAVIPVAGVGTRLRPHTFTLPKVLLNVAGKPILGHILDALLRQGIERATIITGYLGGLVEEFVKKRYGMMDIDFVDQEDRQGLGHAIWMGRETYGGESLLIILGDTIFDVDLSLAFQSGMNSLGVKEVDDPRRFGVVVRNGDGMVNRLVEKPETPVSNLALVGLYFIKNGDLLNSALDELIKNNMRTRGEYQLTDALQLLIESGEQFTTFPVEGWYDCGKPETLLSTNKYLLEKSGGNGRREGSIVIPPSYIAPNAIIERSVIGPYASVAEDAVVRDSIIKDSIISYGATVTCSILEQSIIGNEAELNGVFNCMNVGNSSKIGLSQ